MTNGLGAGFAALSVLAVLGGLSLCAVVTTAVSVLCSRRAGHVPRLFHYPLLGVGALVLVVAGFGTLAFADEAPLLAGLIAALALVPFPVVGVGVALAARTELGRREGVTATVMAWGLLFLPGLAVVFGVAAGIEPIFDPGPGGSLRRWAATAIGGLALVGTAVPLGARLGRLLATPAG